MSGVHGHRSAHGLARTRPGLRLRRLGHAGTIASVSSQRRYRRTVCSDERHRRSIAGRRPRPRLGRSTLGDGDHAAALRPDHRHRRRLGRRRSPTLEPGRRLALDRGLHGTVRSPDVSKSHRHRATARPARPRCRTARDLVGGKWNSRRPGLRAAQVEQSPRCRRDRGGRARRRPADADLHRVGRVADHLETGGEVLQFDRDPQPPFDDAIAGRRRARAAAARQIDSELQADVAEGMVRHQLVGRVRRGAARSAAGA